MGVGGGRGEGVASLAISCTKRLYIRHFRLADTSAVLVWTLERSRLHIRNHSTQLGLGSSITILLVFNDFFFAWKSTVVVYTNCAAMLKILILKYITKIYHYTILL